MTIITQVIEASTLNPIGRTVKRYQPGDYTHNRIGIILEVNYVKNRARVNWTAKETNNIIMTIKTIKTWVSFNNLIYIQ